VVIGRGDAEICRPLKTLVKIEVDEDRVRVVDTSC